MSNISRETISRQEADSRAEVIQRSVLLCAIAMDSLGYLVPTVQPTSDRVENYDPSQTVEFDHVAHVKDLINKANQELRGSDG